MIVDTSGLVSALVADQRSHRECADALRAAHRRVLSPFVLAEIDHLITRIGGVGAELEMLDQLSSSSYLLAPIGSQDVEVARELVARYRDLGIGLTDASLVVLAERYRTDEILTLDHRHFRAVTGLSGRPFRLLPADL